ncbi:MAG: hypothetical protein VX304_10830, partial [Planctomycetota bacterium]|nr:hypothetical protein [Planctomycetota bacterium]
ESSDKTFKCSIGPDVSKVAQWDLYLLVPVENKETVAVHKIGTYRNGTTKIAVSDVALAISGRPVYAVKTGKQTGQLTPKNAPSR